MATQKMKHRFTARFGGISDGQIAGKSFKLKNQFKLVKLIIKT